MQSLCLKFLVQVLDFGFRLQILVLGFRSRLNKILDFDFGTG